jgi:hypothetical protein
MPEPIFPGTYKPPRDERITRAALQRVRRRAHHIATAAYGSSYRACVAAMLEQLEAGGLQLEQIEQWEPSQ